MDEEGKNLLTPLHVATHYNNAPAVHYLLDHKADPHKQAKVGGACEGLGFSLSSLIVCFSKCCFQCLFLFFFYVFLLFLFFSNFFLVLLKAFLFLFFKFFFDLNKMFC